MYSKNSVRWLYKLEKSFTWASGHPVAEELVFKDKTGEVRLIIETNGDITVTRGYAWNGCSPKVCIFDLLFGTPEGVVHVPDALVVGGLEGRPEAAIDPLGGGGTRPARGPGKREVARLHDPS